MTDCFSFMSGTGWMVWGASAFWLLTFALLLLTIAALIRYLRSAGSAN